MLFDKMRMTLRLNSIRTNTIVYFMGFIAITVVFLSFTSYQNAIRNTERLSIHYTIRLLEEVNVSVNSYIENMKSMGTVVVENTDVRQMMAFFDFHKGQPLSQAEEEELAKLMDRAVAHMNIVAQTRSDITNIAVISKYGDVVLSDRKKTVNRYSDYNLTDWYLKPMSYKNEIVVSPSHVQRLILGEYRWVISISKAILDPNTSEVTGLMLIDLSLRAIEDICEGVQIGKNGYIYLTDAKNNLIYHPQQQLIFSGVKEESAEAFASAGLNDYVRLDAANKIYIRNDSPVTGWSAVGVINTQELLSNNLYTIQFYLTMAALTILFSTLFAVVISDNITRPLRKLEVVMHRVEDGNFDVQADVENDDEIGHMSKTFNAMVLRIRQLIDREVSKEEEKRKIEIRALQAQINPHFLYNTLETIIWMSASGKTDQVVDVTSALARLFRTSISQDESLVELRVELENIESYLTIQKIRYKDKLNYHIDIPVQFRRAMIPKLILQPIVENAIYHGIKPSPVGGHVNLSAHQEGSSLILTVQDDGVGMTSEQLRDVLTVKKKDARGIGVLNVHNRIRLVFGEQYGLRYTHPEGTGTRVEIYLPLTDEREEIES